MKLKNIRLLIIFIGFLFKGIYAYSNTVKCNKTWYGMYTTASSVKCTHTKSGKKKDCYVATNCENFKAGANCSILDHNGDSHDGIVKHYKRSLDHNPGNYCNLK